MDDDTDRYWTRSTGSGNGSKPKVPATTTSLARKGLDRSNWIKKCAQLILGSYRRDDFADPESYAVQLGMVLERYDDKVIEAVTSPATGIQRNCKFPPSIAEFVEFIDEHIRRSTVASTYDQRSREQLREREEIEAHAEPLQRRREVAARILGEYHAALTPEAAKSKPDPWQRFSADDLLRKYPPKHPKQEAAE